MTSDLRDPAQVTPTLTRIISISPDLQNPGGYDVEDGGTLRGDASDTAIMALIAKGQRTPLPTRTNPFNLVIEEQATKIVFHLTDATWFFTNRQFRLKDDSENDTPNGSGGTNREFGSLTWVENNGATDQKTFSIVDTWRRMVKFEYGIFISIQQRGMETIIEIDPDIDNDGC